MDHDQEDWPRGLFFEDAFFPAGNSFDLIEHVANIPEATAAWVFHFTACAGAVNYDRADQIVHHVNVLVKALLNGDLEAMNENVRRRCAPLDRFGQPELVVENWIASLREIIRIAQTCTWCSWIAGDEEDRQWLLDWRLANPILDAAGSISGRVVRDRSRDQRAS